MPFQLVFLWTDILIYVLLAAVTGFGLYAARHEHLRAPWRQVARRPLAMARPWRCWSTSSSDCSIRSTSTSVCRRRRSIPPRSKVCSIRLWHRCACGWRQPIPSRSQSMPMPKETVEHPDGRRTREYPRLKYAGAHLADPADHAADVLRKAAVAGVAGLLVWGLLVAVFLLGWRGPREPFSQALRRLARGESKVPWRTVFVTAGVLILVASNIGYLSLYYHVLGTDQVGQDVLLKSLKSIRTGLVIGTLTTLVMLPFAVLFGLMAGYFRGWVDDVIQYTYTTLSSIPGVLLIAAAILSLQVYMANHPENFDNVVARADTRLLFLCVILGVTSWTSLCRLLRGEALKLREADYVQAAQALGASQASILARHLFPNVMHIVLITVVLDFSGLVLAEAVLSYVGVGVDPSMDSWGNMINSARLEMAREPMVWWSLASAFVLMFGLVLAANLFADAVRDAFDPRLRR